MIKQKKLLITVGTTLFEKLISTLCTHQKELLNILSSRGFSTVTVQYGKGKPPEFDEEVLQHHQIEVNCYDYKDSLLEDIASSDLIISHAGAGTCLEVLNLQKPLIVVVNDSLMHNHQTELANQLASDGHCLSCTTDTLLSAISSLDQLKLIPFLPGKPELFVQCLDEYFGIAHPK